MKKTKKKEMSGSMSKTPAQMAKMMRSMAAQMDRMMKKGHK